MTLAALVGFPASSDGIPAVAAFPPEPERPALRRVLGRDLVHLLIARTFFLAGTMIITTLLFYLTRDVLAASSPERTTGLLHAVAAEGVALRTSPRPPCRGSRGVPILFGSGLAIAGVAAAFLVAGAGYVGLLAALEVYCALGAVFLLRVGARGAATGQR